MLRATRKFLDDNFIKDETISGAVVYRYNPNGYWQMCVNMTFNCIDIYQGEKYAKIVLGKDKEWASTTNCAYTKFFRKMNQFMDLKKFKPKRMTVEDFTKLLKTYQTLEDGMEEIMKITRAKYNEYLAEKDFE